ncbi:MAG TPA: hypothetical protein VH854_14165 [Thermoanaerobaculia bacterium]|jgi:hypothetical protein|nr:hypothetical protein [Thermoanaerobaculia bacterium]
MADHPKSWPLRCVECGDRVEVELPSDVEVGENGTLLCRRGHLLLFHYDGVTVKALEVVYEGR